MFAIERLDGQLAAQVLCSGLAASLRAAPQLCLGMLRLAEVPDGRRLPVQLACRHAQRVALAVGIYLWREIDPCGPIERQLRGDQQLAGDQRPTLVAFV